MRFERFKFGEGMGGRVEIIGLIVADYESGGDTVGFTKTRC